MAHKNDTEHKKEKKPKVNPKAFVIAHFKLLFVFVIGVSAAFGYFVLVQPPRRELAQKLSQDFDFIEKDKQAKELIFNQLSVNVKNFSILQQQNTEAIGALLRPVSDKEQIIFALNDIANQAGVFVQKVTIQAPVTPDAYFGEGVVIPVPIIVVPISMTLGGIQVDYRVVKDILQLLHSRYGIFNVATLSLENLGETSSVGEDAASKEGLRLDIDVFFRE